MRLARILVDLDRYETAVEAGILLLCPHGAIFRRESGVVEDLSEHFGPPSLIDAEPTALSGEIWPMRLTRRSRTTLHRRSKHSSPRCLA